MRKCFKFSSVRKLSTPDAVLAKAVEHVVPVMVVALADDPSNVPGIDFEESCSLEGGVSMAFFKVIGVTVEASSQILLPGKVVLMFVWDFSGVYGCKEYKSKK